MYIVKIHYDYAKYSEISMPEIDKFLLCLLDNNPQVKCISIFSANGYVKLDYIKKLKTEYDCIEFLKGV